MSISLQNSLVGSEPANVQLLPCEINYNGKADIQKYFLTKSRKDSDTMEASFRGRKLVGKKTKLPQEYTGIIVKERKKVASDAEKRVLHMEKKFDSFTRWNLGTTPSSNDNVVRALEWIDIAKALHDTNDDDSDINGDDNSDKTDIKDESAESSSSSQTDR